MVSPNPLVGDVRTIERDELLEKIERGDEFRLVMALNEWAFRAKHIPSSEHFNTPDEFCSRHCSPTTRWWSIARAPNATRASPCTWHWSKRGSPM